MKIFQRESHFFFFFFKFYFIFKLYNIVLVLPNIEMDAWGWCTGTTQREGMGREEGGGFRMGSTGIPVADSFRESHF